MKKSVKLAVTLFGLLVSICGFFLMSTVSLAEMKEGVEDAKEIVLKNTAVRFKKPNAPIKMVAVGDMMMGRYVETLMNANGDDYPFEKVQDLIEDQDIIFGNLEGPIASLHSQTPDFSTSFSFHPRIAEVLASQGFTIVSLANNHTLDRGAQVYQQTVDYLSEQGVASFGHPRDEGADYIYETEIKDTRIVFVGFNEAVNPYFDESKASETIAAKAVDEEAVVIASVHWGIEYQLESYEKQQRIAHSLIDAGADLIIGHHPHVTQEVEIYNDRLIFYSLGNFIFDQYFSKDVEQGLAFEMALYEDGIMEFDLLPIQSEKSQPRLMTGEEKSAWLNEYAERAKEDSLKEQVRTGKIRVDIN